MKTILFGIVLMSMCRSALGCPYLAGVFAEDDFGITIEQPSCESVSLEGKYALAPGNHRYSGLVTDGEERPCFEDGDYRKFCRVKWVGDELHLDIRGTAGGQEFFQHLYVARCDSFSPACSYGTKAPSDTLRVTTESHAEILIPRR